MGAPDMAVRVGAPINLTCVISHSTDQLQFVFWYRDQLMINYDLLNAKRGKVVVSKLNSTSSTSTSSNHSLSFTTTATETFVSNLQIYRSTLADSGNYTCMPSGANGKSVSIYVHVLEGESRGEECLRSADLSKI